MIRRPPRSTLSLHDALPISYDEHHISIGRRAQEADPGVNWGKRRSEEHTSELQSRFDLVCRLLLEKKKKKNNKKQTKKTLNTTKIIHTTKKLRSNAQYYTHL